MHQPTLARRSLWRRRVLTLAAVSAVAAVLLAASGGFRVTVGGLRLSARSPLPASIAGLVLAAAWYGLARKSGSVSRDLEEAWTRLDRHALVLTLFIAAASGAVAGFFGTVAASGADASGYLSEARLFISGRLFYHDALASIVGGWQTGLTSPLGWRPAPVEALQSPTYPPGLPWLMAIPIWLGSTVAACSVVVVSAGIAVWSTAMIARHFAGGIATIIAGTVLAVSPVFLFQSVQPMSDVPVTAAWMVCWWILARSGSGLLAGLACASAVLIRPNLAPLAVVPLAVASLQTPAFRFRWQRAVAFSLPVAFAGLALLWLQWQWYGSPLRSGYGTAGELFALANIGPNAVFYFGGLVSTAPIMFVALLGAFLVRREPLAWGLTASAALVVAAYLVYAVFDDWSYLRFLLPALAVGAVFVGVAMARMVAVMPVAARAGVVLVTLLAVTAAGLAHARTLGAFDLQDQHRRVVQIGEHLNGAIPGDAAIVAGEQSGAMRYYTGRPIIRWDAASPSDMATALGALETAGRPVWIVLDAWETELFRAKFADVPAAALDWPPAVMAGTTHRTTAWQLADRERFLHGENPATLRLP